jgi:hypothetical protein
MKYLFAFEDETMCRSFARALKNEGIDCEVRNAIEFPDGTQGPELWVRNEADYHKAMLSLAELQRET